MSTTRPFVSVQEHLEHPQWNHFMWKRTAFPLIFTDKSSTFATSCVLRAMWAILSTWMFWTNKIITFTKEIMGWLYRTALWADAWRLIITFEAFPLPSRMFSTTFIHSVLNSLCWPSTCFRATRYHHHHHHFSLPRPPAALRPWLLHDVDICYKGVHKTSWVTVKAIPVWRDSRVFWPIISIV